MNKMPVVEMPEVEIEPEPEVSDSVIDNLTDNELQELREKATCDIVVEEEEEQVEPEEVGRKHVDNREIFKMAKRVDEVSELKVNKVKKPKRAITEEHKERLRKGRETALANRKKKAAERRAGEALSAEKVAEPAVEIKEVIKEVIVKEKSGLSKDEVMDLVSKASQQSLEQFEYMRKERKVEKKKKNEEEAKRRAIRETIKRATTPGGVPDSPWSSCY